MNVTTSPYVEIILEKVITHPSLVPRHLLKIAVRRMNDTVNDNGLVPIRLVFGALPRFPILNSDIAYQKNQLNCLNTYESMISDYKSNSIQP